MRNAWYASFIFIMFEKVMKRFGSKATDGAIEGAKESLNDRMDKYSDIIEIGLVIGVIAFGGNKLLGHGKKQSAYLPAGRNESGVSGAPIVINNYITPNPMDRNYSKNRTVKGANYGGSGKNHQKR